MKRWKLRRRGLLLGALIILTILVLIHLGSDAGAGFSIGGFSIGGGFNTGEGQDINSQAGLISNERIVQSPVVPTHILTATSHLDCGHDVYLDGSAAILN
jgi:hypothetical protein